MYVDPPMGGKRGGDLWHNPVTALAQTGPLLTNDLNS